MAPESLRLANSVRVITFLILPPRRRKSGNNEASDEQFQYRVLLWTTNMAPTKQLAAAWVLFETEEPFRTFLSTSEPCFTFYNDDIAIIGRASNECGKAAFISNMNASSCSDSDLHNFFRSQSHRGHPDFVPRPCNEQFVKDDHKIWDLKGHLAAMTHVRSLTI